MREKLLIFTMFVAGCFAAEMPADVIDAGGSALTSAVAQDCPSTSPSQGEFLALASVRSERGTMGVVRQ